MPLSCMQLKSELATSCQNLSSEFCVIQSISVTIPDTIFMFVRETNAVIQYRVAQNHGKQVLRVIHTKFHLPVIQFVVIPHGQRDLGSLPWLGGAAGQIS